MLYKLKAKRVEKGISQRTFAKQLQITPQQLCKIENGKVSPRLDLMRKSSDILETPIQDLW